MTERIQGGMECPFEKIYPSELNRDDRYYMSLAYNCALDAWKEDEVPIGAVIVYKDKIIAKAHNRVEGTKDPTAHAEILAITAASNALEDWRLNEATLYVTKEPCPMCSGALLMSRVGRVVYALADENMGCLGGATNLNALEKVNHHLEITIGVMEEECRELIQAYFQMKRKMSKEKKFQ
jgi:tRNA(adenine34) deaminase